MHLPSLIKGIQVEMNHLNIINFFKYFLKILKNHLMSGHVSLHSLLSLQYL